MLDDLAVAHGDGRWARLMAAWTRVDVLLVEDLALRPLTADQAADLLKVIEDRSQRRSTIVTSQLPVANWHEALGDPTLADAILDRLTHNAHRIELRGDSLRRSRPQTDADEPDPPTRRGRATKTAAESASEAR
jgi:DNA replication protein DnaC